ncbi:MAG TPA: hypothetical protein VNZ27_04945 [Rhodanobacter sp.]|jgi:hypothetical protein|nr:hypothetical protein [Rhodanobacter sp.]
MNTLKAISQVAKTTFRYLAALGEILAAIHGAAFLVVIIGWLVDHVSMIAF